MRLQTCTQGHSYRTPVGYTNLQAYKYYSNTYYSKTYYSNTYYSNTYLVLFTNIYFTYLYQAQLQNDMSVQFGEISKRPMMGSMKT